MSMIFDEYGRPFIILREQQAQARIRGKEAQKVSNRCTVINFFKQMIYFLYRNCERLKTNPAANTAARWTCFASVALRGARTRGSTWKVVCICQARQPTLASRTTPIALQNWLFRRVSARDSSTIQKPSDVDGLCGASKSHLISRRVNSRYAAVRPRTAMYCVSLNGDPCEALSRR